MMSGRVIQLERVGAITIPALTDMAVTTTSPAIRANGNNAVILHFNITGTGAFTPKIQGAPSHNGNFADMYDNNGNLMSMGSLSADRSQIFIGIPEHFKIVATEDTNGATATISYELLTV